MNVVALSLIKTNKMYTFHLFFLFIYYALEEETFTHEGFLTYGSNISFLNEKRDLCLCGHH